MISLTPSQESNVRELRLIKGLHVRFWGVDALDRPVLHVKGEGNPIYLVLRHDGADLSEPADVIGKLRELSDDEVECFDPGQFELLCSLGFKSTTQGGSG